MGGKIYRIEDLSLSGRVNAFYEVRRLLERDWYNRYIVYFRYYGLGVKELDVRRGKIRLYFLESFEDCVGRVRCGMVEGSYLRKLAEYYYSDYLWACQFSDDVLREVLISAVCESFLEDVSRYVFPIVSGEFFEELSYKNYELALKVFLFNESGKLVFN